MSLTERNIVYVHVIPGSKRGSSLSCHLPATGANIFLIIASFRFIQEKHLDNELINDLDFLGHTNLFAFEPTSQAMYDACWAFTRTTLWFLYWYGSGDCHPVVLIYFDVHQGHQCRILTQIPEHPEIEDYPIYLVFDLDMVHLTTLDRKIMGQMVRRRLRHAPCRCSGPLMKSIPVGAWFDIHFSSCWVKIRDSWDIWSTSLMFVVRLVL